MKITTLILLIALVLSACSLAAPTPDPKVVGVELDALIQEHNQAGLFDGSVLVAQNGQVILSKGYGFADRENKIPNTPQTKFRLGCVTKQFTAMAILLLQEQGKLNVEDKLCNYITDCPGIFQDITIRHLLSNSSGIPNTTSWSKPGNEMLSSSNALYYEPGEGFLYTDVGFNFAGRIIESVSGQSYGSYLQQNIFDPLHMSNTGVDDHQQTDLAMGYLNAEQDTVVSPLNGLFAEGNLYSTVEDLYLWDQALYTDQLLPQSSLKAMFTSQVAVPDGKYYGGEGWSYGLGWFISPEGPVYAIHGGMYPGYRTEIRRYIDDKITIILLTNHEAVLLHPTADAIAEALLGSGK